MNGSLQICKADVCVTATGDFAKAILALLALALLVVLVAYAIG